MMALECSRRQRQKKVRFLLKLQNVDQLPLRKTLKEKYLFYLSCMVLLIVSGGAAGNKGNAFMPEMESTDYDES